MPDENKTRAREIVETAVRLFAVHGFDGVSVRDICAELSVNSSIISYYFGGKKGLYLEVLKNQFTAHGQVMENLKDLEPREALLTLIDLLRDFSSAHPHFAALVTRESGRPSPEFIQAAGEYEKRFGDKLTDIIRSGQRQGVFKHNLKLSALIPAINVLLNSSAASGLSRLSHGSFSENDYFETIKTLLLEGLAADPAEGGRGIGKQSAKPRNTVGR